MQIEKSSGKSLNESISKAKAVIGINSMALLIAHIMKKPVVSYIPLSAESCLPLPKKCLIDNIMDIPDLDVIPCFEDNGSLSFFNQYPLEKMMTDFGKPVFGANGVDWGLPFVMKRV